MREQLTERERILRDALIAVYDACRPWASDTGRATSGVDADAVLVIVNDALNRTLIPSPWDGDDDA